LRRSWTLARWCLAEKSRLQREIARIGNLADDDLVKEFCPEVERDRAVQEAIDAGAATDIRDVLARGNRGPEQEVVSRNAPPVRREGGDPRPLTGVNGMPLPPNVVFTYDKDLNLVPVPQ
jgi:hypothetical protein